MMVETNGFFSRDSKNWDFPDIFNDSDKYVYFIEDKITNRWLSKNINLNEWTIDPLKAMSFKNRYKASTFANENKIYGQSGIIITEHEFLFSPPKEKT